MLFDVAPTIFYVTRGNSLNHILKVQITNNGDGGKGKISMQFPDGTFETALNDIPHGKSAHQILIPELVKAARVNFTLFFNGKKKLGFSSVFSPPPRWTVFLIHHSHTDIGYTAPQEKVFAQHENYLNQVVNYCKATEAFAEESKFKWVCEVSWAVENYIKRQSGEKLHDFLRFVREGRIEVTALYLQLTDLFSYEELARSLYFANHLRKKHGIKITAAMQSDINGLSWGLAQLLAQSGVKYLNMAVNEDWGHRGKAPLKRPCAFYWKAPDDSSVLVWNGEHYHKGNLLGLPDNYDKALRLLPEYLEQIHNDGYLHDFVSLQVSGAGIDNAPPNIEICRLVRKWNSKWAYPKMKIATLSEFFQHLEKHHTKPIPVYQSAWPDWWADGSGSSAYETGLNRKTHNVLLSAEKFSAFCNIIKPDFRYRRNDIEEAYKNAMFFDEHTWGSALSIAKPYSLDAKFQWAVKSAFAYEAAIKAREVLSASLAGMSSVIKTKSPAIVVYNPMSWERQDIASLSMDGHVLGSSEQFEIVDSESNDAVPYQIAREDDGRIQISFVAAVPPLGYKIYEIAPNRNSCNSCNAGFLDASAEKFLENKFYRIAFDPATGGIQSLYDKELKKELVDVSAGCKVNQYIHEEAHVKSRVPGCSGQEREVCCSDSGVMENVDLLSLDNLLKKVKQDRGSIRNFKFSRTSPLKSTISRGKKGAAAESMITETKWKGCSKIVQEVILYSHDKRVDIINTLFKEENTEPAAVYYAFAFNVPDASINFEIAGAIMKPETQQLPGSCRDFYSIQHWLDISNSQYGITWATAEAPLVQFCRINTGRWLEKLEINNSTFFSWVMNNYWHTNFRASQSGKVVFKYSITSHRGRCNKASAARFGWDCSNPLIPVLHADKAGKTRGILPSCAGSFCSLNKKNVMTTAVKQAEDGKGVIVRLCELSGKDTVAAISLPHFRIKRAYVTDIVENNLKSLKTQKNASTVSIPIHGYGTQTVRIMIKDYLQASESTVPVSLRKYLP